MRSGGTQNETWGQLLSFIFMVKLRLIQEKSITNLSFPFGSILTMAL